MDVRRGIRSKMNTLEGQQLRVVQASKKITEKRLKWYGHVRSIIIVRRMLDVDIPGKRRRGRPNLRWKDACKRDKSGSERGFTTNRAAWRNKIISYTGDTGKKKTVIPLNTDGILINI